MRTRKNFRDPRTRRAKRALRRLHDPPSQRTLKSLKNLSYRDLKALSSEQLQKYKRRLHIIDQEGNPYTDEELRKKLRPYISPGSKKGGGKTFKKEQKNANKKYYQSVKKCRKMKDKTEKDRKKKGKCYLPLDKQRFKTLQYLEKEYPDEWLEFKNKKGDSFHNATRLEGSGLYDWNPYKGERSSPRKGGGKSVYLTFQEGTSDKFWSATKDGQKITTKWGRIGTAGSSTTKDYGSDVDEEYEKLIQSKKKKGYVEAKESKSGSKSESKKTLRKELDCKKFTRYHKGKGNRLQWPPVMMGIPAGKGQVYEYLGKYNQFTDEPVPVKKGLVAKRVKNPDDDAWGQYCGDRRPASKADMPVHPGSQKYFIHDNGGRPFLVYVAGNNVWIYKHSKKTVVEDQKDFDNPKYYTELVKEYTAKQVFIGKSPKNEMTKYSGGHGPKFTGNSILLKIGDKRYVSIGWTIYEFSTKDEITEYHSPVGNSDVPYPIAIGTDYVYFMIEEVYVAKELFEDFPKEYKWHDHAYAKLWGQEPFTSQNKGDMKKHRKKMMNIKMVHKRTQ